MPASAGNESDQKKGELWSRATRRTDMVGVFSPESVCSFSEIGRRVTPEEREWVCGGGVGIESKKRSM